MTPFVDVVIPTLGRPHITSCLGRLHFIPWPIKLHVVHKGYSWPEAVNIGLSQCRNDVLLMDDDVFLEPQTLDCMELPGVYESGDIFGFKLLFPSGNIQHGGGFWRGDIVTHYGRLEKDKGQCDAPFDACHVTTSLVYIKRKALDVLGGMAMDYPGIQYEDVDFSFRAIKGGFKIRYLGGRGAIHIESASKGYLPDFVRRASENWEELKKRHLGDELFLRKLENLRKQPIAA